MPGAEEIGPCGVLRLYWRRRGEWLARIRGLLLTFEGSWGASETIHNRAIRNGRLCYADGVGHEDARDCAVAEMCFIRGAATASDVNWST